MLGDSCFCGRYFSPVYKKNGINAGRTNGTNKPHYAHEYFTIDVRWIGSIENNSLFAVRWSFHLMSYSRLQPLQSLKQILTCENLPLTVSITLRHLAIVNYFEETKFSFWACLLPGRHTVTKWMLTQFCPQTFRCFRDRKMKITPLYMCAV